MNEAKLRALAEKATPGPWTADAMGSEGYHIHGGAQRVGAHTRRLRLARVGFEDWDTDRANAEFIAAACPDRVSALLDRLAKMERLFGDLLTIHSEVVMDTEEDRALHADVVATFRAAAETEPLS